MTDPLDIVLTHAIETLPDSISARKQLLRAMSHVITEKHPAYNAVMSQIAVIESLEELQAKLPIQLKGPIP